MPSTDSIICFAEVLASDRCSVSAMRIGIQNQVGDAGCAARIDRLLQAEVVKGSANFFGSENFHRRVMVASWQDRCRVARRYDSMVQFVIQSKCGTSLRPVEETSRRLVPP
jgi:hypothetical protein